MNETDLQAWLKRNPELAVQNSFGGEHAIPTHEKNMDEDDLRFLPKNPPPATAVPIYKTVADRVVNMKPFGKARPRVTQNGQHTYMPPDYEKNKELLGELFGGFDIPDLVRLTIIAIRPLPKSWSKKKRDSMNGKYASPKPDTDNILGAVMDALFPEDDDIVVDVKAKKIWGEDAAIHIKIESIRYTT